MKKYHWYTCINKSSNTNCKCGLNRLNLKHEHFGDNPDGVYIIWHRGNNEQIVKVGQGDLKDRFSKHKKDPKIQQYNDKDLIVSWIIPPANELDGIERYLGDYLNPIEAEKFPGTEHIEVELSTFIPKPNTGEYRYVD